MKGKELIAKLESGVSNVYTELVSLNYSRKENYLYDSNEIEWRELGNEVKGTILSFPTRHIDWFVDLMDIEDLEGDQQFYLFHSEGKTFLVDTQGYNYPRYIVQLVGFEDEFGPEEFMEGLVRISDDIIIEQAIKSIVLDLCAEGFDKDDVENFLQKRIESLIKKTIASKANLFT